MAYEIGMAISWKNAECVVVFRGKEYKLGTFASYEFARQAGEECCRKLGWKG